MVVVSIVNVYFVFVWGWIRQSSNIGKSIKLIYIRYSLFRDWMLYIKWLGVSMCCMLLGWLNVLGRLEGVFCCQRIQFCRYRQIIVVFRNVSLSCCQLGLFRNLVMFIERGRSNVGCCSRMVRLLNSVVVVYYC